MPQPNHQALGKRGEQLAADYLSARGYTIIATNWHCTAGEIDVIARKDQTVVFVEVRTRRSGIETAFASISPRKRRLLTQAAYRYLAEHPLSDEHGWRIDAIAVAIPAKGEPVIEHVEDALDW